ncbi:MAG TPA: helicase-exonuclease AddAB subunit AddA [Firmicutes bacterium]|nr:helicase-exonuclease AddAB subunit AddA [Bacillota bacterium]
MTANQNRWTEEQRQAIGAAPGNILVAAAAGAGKTAVLVERVIRRVLDPARPVDIDRLLVVTFTEAAAAEMRQRIGRALEAALAADPGSAYLQRQLALLGRAAISTLHSFCLKAVRRYFYQLELDPGFKVMDEAEADLVAHEVLDELWEEEYAREVDAPGPFAHLLDCYSSAGSDDELKDLLLKLHAFSRSQPWPEHWLREAAASFSLPPDAELTATPWARPLREYAARQLEQAALCLERAAVLAARPGGPEPYLAVLKEEQSALQALAGEARAGTWEELRAGLAYSFDRLPSVRREEVDPELKKQVTDLRDAAKKILKDLREDVFGRPPADLLAELTHVAPAVRTLVELALAFGRRYQAAKHARGRLDFADLEHYALRLLLAAEAAPGELKPSALARELTAEYAEVFVDEYQDINPVQDAILSLISGQDTPRPHLFQVGDVKQSIYRFRLAEPRLFLAKYHGYPTAAGGRERRISLRANFRSRAEVIAAVNFIFRQLFTPAVGGFTYDAEAELVAGARYPDPPAGGASAAAPVEVHLIERQAPEVEVNEKEEDAAASLDLSALEKEALVIGRRIQAMVRGTPERPGPAFQVWDKAAQSYRPVTYRDIVILLRTVQGRAATILEVLRELEIPAYADLAGGYFDAPEVATLLSLLEIIDNPYQDIPLAAVLRSPLVGLSAEELAAVRLAAPEGEFSAAVWAAAAGSAPEGCGAALTEKLAHFRAQLEEWRTAARRGTLAELIWRIYRETGYLAYVAGLPAGAQRQANLRALYDRARQFESFGRPGLFRFLRFLKRLKEQEGDLGTARALGENENVVRVMSIHKSKGLEFPVVFVADLGKQFNLDDLKGDILLHRDLGLGPLVVDLNLRLKYPSLAYRAIQVVGREETLAEELRILYVALTRARERLVLVGSAPNLDARCRHWAQVAGGPGWELAPGDILGARTYLDWLGPALARHPAGEVLRAGLPVLAPDPAVAADPSRWELHLYPAAEVAALAEPRAPADSNEPGAAQVSAPGEPEDPELAEAVRARLTWRYPQAATGGLAAKVSVSELKQRALLGAGREEEEAPGHRLYPVRPAERPRFAGGSGELAGAARGSAAHLVLQHLDLSGDLSPAGIEAQVAKLTEREFLNPEEAAGVDAAALAAFFAGPLGQRLTSRPAAVRREVPFSLRLPAGEVYPAAALTPTEATEPILVQGIIDCLVAEPEGWLLLDFKTDAVPPAVLAARLPGYQKQVELYVRAVTAWSRRPVSEAYLYFLAAGRAVRVFPTPE